MFHDLHNLTGGALGREAERCLYGVDCDAPSAQPHHPFMAYNSAWGSTVGGAMTRVYSTRAKALGLPALLGDDRADTGGGSRASELLMTFRGGFEVRIGLADVLDSGLITALVLHRLMRRAAKDRTLTHQHRTTMTPNYPFRWYPALPRVERFHPSEQVQA